MKLGRKIPTGLRKVAGPFLFYEKKAARTEIKNLTFETSHERALRSSPAMKICEIEGRREKAAGLGNGAV